MSKFSVKKPLTVFVAVIAVLVLGVVAYTRMTPDLLPNMDFPYVMIMTPYPGASPEKVEAEITKPMEQAMSTLEHIKTVSSNSGENASMVMLEFEESVNMDTIGVDIQQKITQLSANWDEAVSSPYVLKINPSMLPVEVAALSMEGMDTIALTEFVDDTLMNKLEGIPGVARISATGKIQSQLHVILDQGKIDDLNQRIADTINGNLDEAAEELADKKQDLQGAKGQMSSAQSKLEQGADAMVQGEQQLKEKKKELLAAQKELQTQLTKLRAERVALAGSYETLRLLNNQVVQLERQAQDVQAQIGVLDGLLAEQQEIEDLKAQLEQGGGEPEPTVSPEGGESKPTEPEEPEGESKPTVPEVTEGGETGTTTPEGTESTDVQTGSEPTISQEEPAAQSHETEETAQSLALDSPVPLAVSLTARMEAPVLHLLADGQTDLEILLAEKIAQHQQHLLEQGFTTDAEVASAKAKLVSQQAVLEAALVKIDQTLEAQGTSRSELAGAVAELKAGLDKMDAGIAQLEKTQKDLETGLITVEEAQSTLEEQKLKGMLQLSTAAGKLAAGAASIDMALQQIDTGLDTLEDSREDALRQADLNNIITMDMVTKVLTAQNFAMPAGYVQDGDVSYMVSVGDEITDLETLENLLLFDLGIEGIEPVHLKDVAVVMRTDNRDETYAKLNGQDGVMLSFEKQSTYATAETTNNIQARFRQLEQEYPGLRFVSLMNQGDYIYLIVDSILSSLLLGALFAIVVLYIFLKDLRPTFITLCSIPVSVIFAIVLMYFSGVTINMISLSGLAVAVGMLVDNSVVVIENIYRLRAKGANVIQAAVSGAGQVAGAVTASTLTTVCVFAPIVFVEGITRQLFTDLALTMTYALLASLIVSLTLVPAMASGMLRKQKEQKPGFLETKLLPLYRKAVTWTLGHKAVVLAGAAVLLVVTAVASLSRGFIFMPQMDMPNVSVTVTMPEGADMDRASDLADQVLQRIDQVAGIDTVGAMMDVGTSSTAGVAQTNYTVTIYITLSDENASGAAAGREIEQLCQDLPCTVSASSAMMDMSMLTGSGVSLNLYSEDMDALQQAAVKTAETLGGLEGIGEVSNGLEDAAPALHVRVDQNKAMCHGLTVAQIYMELASGLKADGVVASLELDGITTEVIVQKPEGAVLDAQELRDYVFEITGQDGEITQVPLKDFAKVENTASLSSINRLNQRRYLTVNAQIQPGYNVTLLTEQAKKALAQLDLGQGVSYQFTGENENIMDAMGQLMMMLILGVLLVYLVMVAQFQSLKSPFIVMFTIPLAFTGGFLALLLCGMEISVISLIGFVMLTGIIVNNGIVLVDYINQLRLEGMERREAIVEAGITRMRPILMTTITTVLGLIDMAVHKTAGTALMQPIAVVCIGGLVYATLMTLFVVPCIYDLLNRKALRQIQEEDLELLDL